LALFSANEGASGHSNCPFNFTAVVNCGAILQPASIQVAKGARRREKSPSGESSSIRATISFPPELYRTLEEVALQKKVSLAWIVREAAEQYIADKWPLFGRKTS